MRKVLEVPQYIEPDEFPVTRVSGPRIEQVVERGPVLATPVQVGDSVDGGGSTMIIQGVHLALQSERQPDVMMLSCYGGLDDPWLSRAPSVAEMRTAMGDFARLIVPEEALAGTD